MGTRTVQLKLLNTATGSGVQLPGANPFTLGETNTQHGWEGKDFPDKVLLSLIVSATHSLAAKH